MNLTGKNLTALAAALIALLVVGALVLDAVLSPRVSTTSSTPISKTISGVSSSSSTASPPTSSSGISTTSSQSTAAVSYGSQGAVNASCVTVMPYDSVQNVLGGCGFYFSVPVNGCCHAQTLPNGTEETSLGWTLVIEARQSTGPTENATFGWDPAGPSTASGERLPSPANSTLFNGTLSIQWRLYNSTVPRLYAWIATYFPGTLLARVPPASSCTASPWPTSTSTFYQPIVQQVEQDPVFVALAGDRCYSFAINTYGYSQGLNLTTFNFDEYNGTISYPCGYFPAKLVVSQIEVTAVLSGSSISKVVSLGQENDLRDLNMYACPEISYPLWVHSVTLVSPPVPAGPTIDVTLIANLEQAPITNLTAVLSLPEHNQTFDFSAVSPSNPLQPGQLASQTETLVGPASLDTNSTYPMTIAGNFQDGQAFSYQVTIQVQATTP